MPAAGGRPPKPPATAVPLSLKPLPEQTVLTARARKQQKSSPDPSLLCEEDLVLGALQIPSVLFRHFGLVWAKAEQRLRATSVCAAGLGWAGLGWGWGWGWGGAGLGLGWAGLGWECLEPFFSPRQGAGPGRRFPGRSAA